MAYEMHPKENITSEWRRFSERRAEAEPLETLGRMLKFMDEDVLTTTCVRCEAQVSESSLAEFPLAAFCESCSHALGLHLSPAA
jgi:hypothetical protein